MKRLKTTIETARGWKKGKGKKNRGIPGKFNELRQTKRKRVRDKDGNGRGGGGGEAASHAKTRDARLHTCLHQTYPRWVTRPVEGCNAGLHGRVPTRIPTTCT